VISEEVAEARGYRTVTVKADLRRLGFSDAQCRVPALVIPLWSVDGEPAGHQARPDEPRRRDGRVVKYETPRGTRMVLDVHPSAREELGDPAIPLFITEGVKKGDAAVSAGLCCVALLGVWNWRGTNGQGGTTALPDWERIALNERTVYVVFDSDVMLNPQVSRALARLGAFLGSRGAHVGYVYLPAGPQGQKVGLDDFLAQGNGVDEVLSHAVTEPLGGGEGQEGRYFIGESGLMMRRETSDGAVEVPLANFTARIVADVAVDDGTGQFGRRFQVEADVGGRPHRFDVPADRFFSLNWVPDHLGATAVVFPEARGHFPVAVQMVSDDPVSRTVYAHTGWTEINGRGHYLTAGAVIARGGAVSDVEVSLGGLLGRFALPEPPEGEQLREAVNLSLDVLEVAPWEVTIPVYAAIWRACLGPSRFSVWIAGPTGAGKSQLAALAQQHYGAEMDAEALPGSWTSTPNALEGLLFGGKDALVVIDDFAPEGTTFEVQRYHATAARVLRSQGNGSGRSRMAVDQQLRNTMVPRGLLLATGEDFPRGHSVNARTLVVELGPDDLNWDKLSLLQVAAHDTAFSGAMAGFLRWRAARYRKAKAAMPGAIARLRDRMRASGPHRRTPTIVADLAYGLNTFTRFAESTGALSERDATNLRRLARRKLLAVAEAQRDHHSSADPVERFFELLCSALATGRAHMTTMHDGQPPDAAAWGWTVTHHDRVLGDTVVPQGRRIGWVDRADLYLDLPGCLRVINAGQAGESIAIGSKALTRRMAERGRVVTTDSRPGRILVRKTIGGIVRTVLHVRASEIVDPPDP
jgi:hypothetical protein